MKSNIFKRPFVWIRIVLICSLVIISLWAIWFFGIHQSRAATIIDVSGTVLLYQNDRSGWVTAMPGIKIRAGDQIYTQAPDGVASIGTDDGKIGFQLEPDTMVTFTARWNPILKSGTGGVYVDHGTLMAETRHELQDSATRFAVETSAARATIVGSRLMVQALRGIPTTRVSALEGEIRVEATSDQASILMDDLNPSLEKEVVLTSAETVIVYLKQPETTSEEFDRNLGRVIDQTTQEGVQGVVVQVVGAPELYAITDEEGYFAIPGDRIYGDLVIAGTTQQTSGDLVIQPIVNQLIDRVIDGVTEVGINKTMVTPLDYPQLAVVTDPSGTFEIFGLPAGLHSLSVVVEGYLSQVVKARITADGKAIIDPIYLFTREAVDEFEFLPIILNFSQYP